MLDFFKEYVTPILLAIGSLGVLAGGIGVLIGSIKRGSRAEKEAIIQSARQSEQFWKDQAEGHAQVAKEKDRIYSEKFETLSSQLGQLRGQLDSEIRQKKEYLEILQNRDPAMKSFMELMVQAADNQAKVNKEMVVYKIH